ncbi:MAG: polysaccharide biosynthesis protein [Phycisphaerales bacterium]|nr:polysaccharide biosynthesis protein [Phycisphaerales bacterium]
MTAPASTPDLLLIAERHALPTALAHLGASEAHAARLLGVLTLDPTETGACPRWAPSLGTLDDLERVVHETKPAIALLAIPAAMTACIAQVRERCAALNLPAHYLPTLDDLLAGDPASALPAFHIDLNALVGRPVRDVDAHLVRQAVTGKRVLITGAGGSIGAELARLCARFEPEDLILMDRSDNAIFEIDRELKETLPNVPRKAILHDVVDAALTRKRLESLRPQIIFHAAAHKHVPLMEDHPAEAVKNNLFGTKSVADAALALGIERFVMISTDKAVNPTSVMGATKRLAELYIRALNDRGDTRFTLVRFGNVLGSACSVLPIWSAQLAQGGPITVTDARMTRYFMTIPEAAALVVQSGALSDSAGDVFVLDMGDPVRILDLAQRFLRAHAIEPDANAITLTGARPGEKLHEELAYDAEELAETPIPGVLSWVGRAEETTWIDGATARLAAACARHDPIEVLGELKACLPEFTGGSLAEIPVNRRYSQEAIAPGAA